MEESKEHQVEANLLVERKEDNYMQRVRVNQGYLVKNTPTLPLNILERTMCSDEILKKGLLFVGGARQGKTTSRGRR